MATPTLITISGPVSTLAGTAETGSVIFESRTIVRSGTTADVMMPGAITGVISAGALSMQVPASSDPGWNPSSWPYRVTVDVPSGRFSFDAVVPHDAPGGVLEFADLLPSQPADGELYAAFSHTHTGYVSSSALTTGLAGKLDKADGQVTDSTLEVLKGDGSSGLRLRSTGGAVDIDKRNGDIVVSSWAGPGYTGTQTGLQRWRANGTTLAGLTEFGGTVYQAQQSINAASGTANFLDTTVANLNVTGTVTGGAFNNVVRAADHSLAGWTFDPIGVQAATAVSTAGVSHIVRIRVTSTLITNILLHMTVGGSALTAGQCFAELFTDAGTRLASTADQAAAWISAGMKTMPLTTPQTVTAGSWYKVRFWFNGTTGPTLSRGVNSSSAILNVGLSAPNFRFATADTGLTTAALAATTIGTMTGAATAWWVGLS